MGVTQPSVAAFEREDSNPTLSTIRRYALAVGARISYQVLDAFESSSKKA
jgi:transcriptional regulator with XRE-family HTH domain